MGFAASDILNKYSSWVRASVLESTGSLESISIVGEDPAKRKRTIFLNIWNDWDKMTHDIAPYDQFPGYGADIRAVMSDQNYPLGLITLDPNIRTIDDLRGKRVSVFPRGSTKSDQMIWLVDTAGGDIVESIDWQYTAYEGYDDMIMGKVDAATAFVTEMIPGQKYTAPPKLAEVMSKKKVYFITRTWEQVRRGEELYGPMVGWATPIRSMPLPLVFLIRSPFLFQFIWVGLSSRSSQRM